MFPPSPGNLPVALLAAAAASVLVTSSARAEPVTIRLKNDVPQGQRPSLVVTAIDKVLELEIELVREDGAKFVERLPALARMASHEFRIGDGKPGQARYKGTLRMVVVGGGPWSADLDVPTIVRAPVSITYDADHIDLGARRLEFQLSRPAAHAEVVALDDAGEELGRGSADYPAAPPGTWLALPWTQERPDRPMVLRVSAVTSEGLRVAIELVPWSVTIEHEEVQFDTGSAEVRPSEASKLDASLVKIRETSAKAGRFIKVKLWVAGHTDTVGARDHNLALSLARARAIATYFRRKGLSLPIAYEGFGEEVLRVTTPDETDEIRNRRADYVLGGDGVAAPFSSAYRKGRARWSPLK